MTNLFISGPDALRLLSDTGVNSFAEFTPNKAKQFVAVNHEGHLVGDAIRFHLDDDLLDLVGWHTAIDWVRYHGETGDYDVSLEIEENSSIRVDRPPRQYRYEIQGPHGPFGKQPAPVESAPPRRGVTEAVVKNVLNRTAA